MNEFKGTPGPWTVEKHSGEEYGAKENCSFAIIGPPLDEELPGLQLATVVSDCVAGHQANARLIAAAPDLLEALQYALQSLGFEERAKAEAAINKATSNSN